MKQTLPLSGLLLLLSVAPVWAQAPQPALTEGAAPARQAPSYDPLCEMPYDAVLKMGPPRLEYPTVWDAVYRKGNNLMNLFDGVPLGAENVLVVGRGLKPNKQGQYDIVLSEVNSRGRVIAENAFAPKGDEQPHFFGRIKSGFVVIADLKDKKQVRVSFYDAKRVYRSEKIITKAGYDYTSGAYAALPDGGFLMAVNAASRSDSDDQYATLYRFSGEGKQLWVRQYTLGVINRIYGISPLENGNIILAGQVATDTGLMAGWIMTVGSSGEIMWQRSYARGKSARLKAGVMGDQYGYVVMGDVQPSNGQPTGLWLMALNNTGDVKWQRYYRRNDMGYEAVAMSRTKDGRLAATINAIAPEYSGERDHIRLLTLSKRGGIITDEAYINGIGAYAENSVMGDGNTRVVFSTTTSDSTPVKTEVRGDHMVVVKDKDAKATVSQQGWIFLGAPLPEIYDDPCVTKAPPL